MNLHAKVIKKLINYCTQRLGLVIKLAKGLGITLFLSYHRLRSFFLIDLSFFNTNITFSLDRVFFVICFIITTLLKAGNRLV